VSFTPNARRAAVNAFVFDGGGPDGTRRRRGTAQATVVAYPFTGVDRLTERRFHRRGTVWSLTENVDRVYTAVNATKVPRW